MKNMKISSVPQAHIELCEKYGFSLQEIKINCPTTDGGICDVSNARDSTFYLHELAHFVTASPQAKYKPNFGLGTDPAGGMRTERLWSKAFCEEEEDKALIIGGMFICLFDKDLLGQYIKDYTLEAFFFELIIQNKFEAIEKEINRKLLKDFKGWGLTMSDFFQIVKEKHLTDFSF
jgi:hypothetical protein